MPATPKPRRVRVNFELWLTVSAVVISVCALVVSVVQTRIAREQQHASVWPYLQLREEPMDDNLTIYLENNGVGPAIVKRVEVHFQNQRVEYLPALISDRVDDRYREAFFNAGKESDQIVEGDVLKASSAMKYYEITRADSAMIPIRRVFKDSTFRVEIRYADIYGNCWQLTHRWRKNQVVELGPCPK